jgi:hypothetical protein
MNCLIPLLIVCTILFLIMLCAPPTKETMCLCNGPQIREQVREKETVQNRVQRCDYPSHMAGVL